MTAEDFRKIEHKIDDIAWTYATNFFKKGFILYIISFIISINDKDLGEVLIGISAIIAILIPIIILIFGNFLLFTSKKIKILSDAYQKYYKDAYRYDANESFNDINNEEYYEDDDEYNSYTTYSRDPLYDEYLDYMNLQSSSTKKDIKKKYREIAKKYHPDTVAMQGKDKINEAVTKMQKLNEAYEYLMEHFN